MPKKQVKNVNTMKTKRLCKGVKNVLAGLLLTPLLITTVSCTAQKGPENPEVLGQRVFEALKTGDLGLFEKVLPKEADWQRLVKTALDRKDLPDPIRTALMARLDRIPRNVAEILDLGRNNYTAVRQEAESAGVDWSNSTVQKVTFEEETREDDGISFRYAKTVVIHLSDGNAVELDQCVRFPGGWVVAKGLTWRPKVSLDNGVYSLWGGTQYRFDRGVSRDEQSGEVIHLIESPETRLASNAHLLYFSGNYGGGISESGYVLLVRAETDGNIRVLGGVECAPGNPPHQGDEVWVTDLKWEPGDPRCCPSWRIRSRLEWTGLELRKARPVRERIAY